MKAAYDFIVIGAGSAGCAAAWSLAENCEGSIGVLESGPTDAVPQVRVPFGLLWTMGSRRDWRFTSAPQPNAGGRRIGIPRGRMVGGSGSINSMVWFRGRRSDFDDWNLPGWRWADVEPAFEAVEAQVRPGPLPDPHPLAVAFGRSLRANADAAPTPERESAGVFEVNMRNGRRWSAADAFLRPAERTGRVDVVTGADVDRLITSGGRVTGVRLADGREIAARRGVVLSAGAIGSPAILLRSGIGPAGDLERLGIPLVVDSPGIGANLHDHPATGLHHEGARSGYGLSLRQLPAWALSPARWLMTRTGRMTSNFVEAGAFLAAEPGGEPEFQVHFIPYKIGHRGRAITWGEGYFADVNLCRPRSRGRLRLASRDARAAPEIDLGLFADSRDLDRLVIGVKRLREVLADAPFAAGAGREVYPGDRARSDDEIAETLRSRAGTSYHPVGSLRMGEDAAAPVAPDLSVRGVSGLWAADASVMPAITSANTNAPSIMIGYRVGEFVAR